MSRSTIVGVLLLILLAGITPLVAQVSVPQPPQSELSVKSLSIDGAPRWVHGTPDAVTLQVTVENKGDATSYPYDLYYHYEVRGERTYLNGDRMGSWDRNNQPLEGNGGTSTHDEVSWILQPGQHGNGRIVVVIEEIRTMAGPNDREVVRVSEHLFPVPVPRHEMAMGIEETQQLIRPYETIFYRVSLHNLGNTAETVHLTAGGDELPAGLITINGEQEIVVPPGTTRSTAVFLHYDFDASDGSLFNTTLSVHAETQYGRSFNENTSSIMNRLEGIPAGSDVHLDRMDGNQGVVAHAEELELRFRFQNQGPNRDVFDVHTEPDEAFTAMPDMDRVGLLPGESADFRVRVAPQSDVLHGTTGEVRIMVASNRSREPVSISLPVTVHGPMIRVMADASWSERAYVGDTIEIAARLENQGTRQSPCGSIKVTASGPGLKEETLMGSGLVGAVPPGGSQRAVLTLPSDYTAGGNVNHIVTWEPERSACAPVAGTPWGEDLDIQTLPLQRLVRVHDPVLTLSAPAPFEGQPGESVGYRTPPTHAFVLSNDGDAEESVRVQAITTEGKARLLLDQNPFRLGPGESRSIPVDHDLPLPSGDLKGALLELRASIIERPDLSWNASVETRIVDTQPPRIVFPPDLPALWVSGAEMAFRVHVSDDSLVKSVHVVHTSPQGAARSYTLAQQGDEEWAFRFNSFEEGEHLLLVTATDHWGNKANRTTAIEIRDVPPPHLTMMGPNEGDTVSPRAVFEVLIDDELPIRDIHAVIGNASGDIVTKQALPFIGNVTSFILEDLLAPPYPVGNVSISVEAVNIAGARSTVTRTVYLTVPEEPATEGPELRESPAPAGLLLVSIALGLLLLKGSGARNAHPRRDTSPPINTARQACRHPDEPSVVIFFPENDSLLPEGPA